MAAALLLRHFTAIFISFLTTCHFSYNIFVQSYSNQFEVFTPSFDTSDCNIEGTVVEEPG